MLSIGTCTYSPVLRLKQGEYSAFPEVAADVIPRLFPNFIIPPPKERDPELRRTLTPSELVSIPASRLGHHWPLRPCMLDPRALYRKLGVVESAEWLPALFKLAIAANAIPVPVSDLRFIEGNAFEGIQRVVKSHTGSLALRVTFDDLVRADVRKRIQAALLRLVLKPSDCVLILDFADADLSAPDVAAEITVAKFQDMMEVGLWGQVIWQATSYPEKNPAQPGSLIELPRNEWAVWCKAASHDDHILKTLMYGDFAADCAKFNFPTGGTAPIPHYRYSTPKLWLVGRGAEGLTVAEAMRNISVSIVTSGHFAGVAFSKGDKFIADTANGSDGPGGPTTWRKVNTIHHITRAVADIGYYRGYKIVERALEPEPQQGRLFP